MIIRQAVADDYRQIAKIQEDRQLKNELLTDLSYSAEIQNQGFLIGGFSEKDFVATLFGIFLIAEENGQILGYLRVSSTTEFQDNNFKVWLKPELKPVYYRQPHAEIAGVAVSDEQSQQGIATQLLNAAQKLLRAQNYNYLFSIVTISPIFNFPSLKFHNYHSFERIAFGLPTQLFGLENYQAVLFGKKI